MQKPLIGILCARTDSAQNAGLPYDTVNDAYRRAVSDAGGLPVLLPVTEDPQDAARMLAFCSGLLIPGGGDVDPAFYKEKPHALLGQVSASADRAAFAAVAEAARRSLPVLGICRGMQLVNVAMGGSLYQDLSEFPAKCVQHLQHAERTQPMHSVSLEANSLLARLLGSNVRVNTLHHQCVKDPGEGLSVVGTAPDGVPEAMEDDAGRVLLVQWHPEELRREIAAMNALFERLVGQAALAAEG